MNPHESKKQSSVLPNKQTEISKKATSIAHKLGAPHHSSQKTTPAKKQEKPQYIAENSEAKYLIIKSKSFDDKIKSLYQVKTIDRHNCVRVFFEYVSCYEIMQASSKILILDSNLTLDKAFEMLPKTFLKTGVIWDAKQNKYSGILTTSDFIQIISYFYHKKCIKNNKIPELSTWTLNKWKTVKPPNELNLITLTPKDKANTAIQKLINKKIRQIPIIDPNTGNVLDLLTNKKILNYLYRLVHQLPRPKFMNQSIEDLNIGTQWNTFTVFNDNKVIEAWDILVANRKSSLPVLDRQHNLIGVYSKSDAMVVNQTGDLSHLEKPISEVIKSNCKPFAGVMCCRKNESLSSAVIKIVSNNIHSLMMVNQENHLVGILSLSDVMEFITRENLK